MSVLPRSVERVIEEFERLPGIGPKSAARMAYFLLRAPKERSKGLAESLLDMKEHIVTCSSCFNIADRDPCGICSDRNRNVSTLCVVEEPLDVVAMEKSGVYDGVYFVIGGVISPADGIGPEQLRMAELRRRVVGMVAELQQNSVPAECEVIIATNPSLEGEATAAYVADMLSSMSRVAVTRLGMGLSTGADLEYADRLTLRRAMDGRTGIKRRGSSEDEP